jgi:gamma-glutamyltranspeptidase/glutathione hydrolase
LQDRDLGENRGLVYAQEIAAVLRAAWGGQRARWPLIIAESQHTTHFCTADADGMLVSCTFTHGPLWFGSGLVASGTGMVLNCGANLFARQCTDGSLFPLTNLTPVIVACADGSRHAIGSPGGIRIPAVVLQAVLDLVRYKIPLPKALPLPRVSVDFGGNLEAESALEQILPGAKVIRMSDYYGPASGISLAQAGPPVAARDPRFASAVAAA